MIRALRIGNFKAFADTQDVPIRPLTLIFGPNSAGKSSIIHGLALVNHAIATGQLDAERTDVGGEAIDLGGFRQYVHRRDSSKRVELSIRLETAGFQGRLAELLAPAGSILLQVVYGASESGEVLVQACAVIADGVPILSMSARGQGRLRIDRLDQGHAVFREILRAIVLATTTAQDVHEEDFGGMDSVIDALVPELTVDARAFLPRMMGPASPDSDRAQALLFPVSKGDRREDLAAAIRFFLPRALRDLLNGLSDAIAGQVSRLSYLGPLRSYPPRHYLLSGPHDSNWVAGGGQAWDVVARDESVRAAVNRWLGDKSRLATPYKLVVRDYVAEDQLDRLLQLSLVPWTNQIREALTKIREDHEDVAQVPRVLEEYLEGLDEEAAAPEFLRTFRMTPRDTHPDLVLVDERSQTTVSHRDVGIGVSQALPVLVNAYSLRGRLVAIEQPEIHLHPSLQAELGDVVIESALGERRNTFLLETHSEHLLLRVMRRMRETVEGKLPDGIPPVRPDDVIVLYVEPDGSRSIIREMPLNERGELVKAWPGGFFEEGLREVF